MAKDEVKLFGYWASPYSLRVEWALKIKGIEYEYIEEDLMNKSPMLLQYNPVHKKIPVLVHNGKPVTESLVIIEYIDETWKQNPIFSKDPYEKAQARFWVKFADEKYQPSILNAFVKEGEEREIAIKETQAILKTLEKGLNGKFFGGENIGFTDIALGWSPFWTRMAEEIIGVKIVDIENVPLINAWFEGILDVEILKQILPPRDKMMAKMKMHREFLVSAASAATTSESS